MTQSQSTVDNEFDAAKIIVETLTNLDPQQQERALRFASETLGLKVADAIMPPVGHNDSAAEIQGSRAPARAVDIKQFTDAKAPQSDQQFAAVVVYYYQFEAPLQERRDTIDAVFFGEAARLTTRRRPSRHALGNAKKAGYLDSAGHGEFRLNTVGENLVAITLPGKSSAGGPKRGGYSKRKASVHKGVTKKKKRKA